MKSLNKNRIFFLALMTAFASSLYLVEMFIPKPFPFMKVGLSNIVVLLLIYCRFFKEAILVAVAKSVIGSFVTGTLFSPAFLLSISGGIMSCVFMMVFSPFLTHSYTAVGNAFMRSVQTYIPYRHCSEMTHPITLPHKRAESGISIFGLSIIGSFVHLVTQLFLVRVFIIKSDSILLLYPLIAVSSIVAGFLTGLAGYYLNKSIDFRSVYDKACS